MATGFLIPETQGGGQSWALSTCILMSPRHGLDVAPIDSDVLEHDLDVAQMSGP